MRKFFAIIITLLLCVPFGYAQKVRNGRYQSGQSGFSLWQYRKFEFNFAVGTTQFYGDVGGFTAGKNFLGLKDLSLKQTRINLTTGFKYKIKENITARFNMAFGALYATDSRGTNETRGYASSTFFLEPSLMGEYHFSIATKKPNYFSQKGRHAVFLTFLSNLDYYAFAGLGAVSYTVKPNDALAAKNMKTGGFAAVIPFGVGINTSLSKYINVGVEYGIRYAFTDYLDGYSSPYSKSNDIYHLFNLVFTYKMKTNSKGWPIFRP
jgi:hypothetical protein